jgi:hypothetical protein
MKIKSVKEASKREAKKSKEIDKTFEPDIPNSDSSCTSTQPEKEYTVEKDSIGPKVIGRSAINNVVDNVPLFSLFLSHLTGTNEASEERMPPSKCAPSRPPSVSCRRNTC